MLNLWCRLTTSRRGAVDIRPFSALSASATDEYVEVDTEFAISKVSFGSILVPGEDMQMCRMARISAWAHGCHAVYQ